MTITSLHVLADGNSNWRWWCNWVVTPADRRATLSVLCCTVNTTGDPRKHRVSDSCHEARIHQRCEALFDIETPRARLCLRHVTQVEKWLSFTCLLYNLDFYCCKQIIILRRHFTVVCRILSYFRTILKKREEKTEDGVRWNQEPDLTVGGLPRHSSLLPLRAARRPLGNTS